MTLRSRGWYVKEEIGRCTERRQAVPWVPSSQGKPWIWDICVLRVLLPRHLTVFHLSLFLSSLLPCFLTSCPLCARGNCTWTRGGDGTKEKWGCGSWFQAEDGKEERPDGTRDLLALWQWPHIYTMALRPVHQNGSVISHLKILTPSITTWSEGVLSVFHLANCFTLWTKSLWS